MATSSPFISPLAVEAWDAWFRWRDRDGLRDVTVDATWNRVAGALSQNTPAPDRARYKLRLVDAFTTWNLLPDPRVLVHAGTQSSPWNNDGIAAVLNVASFVRTPCTPQAILDLDAMENVARLAVRMLDDALQLGYSTRTAEVLRIGVIGMADAFSLLGMDFDSASARALSVRVARCLADGCLNGSIAVARDRGARFAFEAPMQERFRARGTARELVDEAAMVGLRYRAHTAITSQKRLAWFANHVADAIDPIEDLEIPDDLAASDATRLAAFEGYASALRRQLTKSPRQLTDPRRFVSVPAQLELRAAMQQWIDEPISYPVNVNHNPTGADLMKWTALATDLNLGNFAWRKPGSVKRTANTDYEVS